MFAIAHFGSHCRNDYDDSSDRDILLVCERNKRYRLTRQYEERGFSVSSYSESQLNAMKKMGSLFLQHIKHEGSIVEDEDGEFGEFLDACDFVRPPLEELSRCRDSIGFILSWPENDNLLPWKVDVLYCLIRDLLIKRLAVGGSLAFGLEDICDRSAEEWAVSERALVGLRRAREIKNSYRAGNMASDIDVKQVVSLLKVLLNELGVQRSPKCPTDAVRLCEYVRKSSLPTYILLRTLEAAQLLEGPVCDDTRPELQRIVKLTQNPNAYCSTSRFRRDEICVLLKRVTKTISRQEEETRQLERIPCMV